MTLHELLNQVGIRKESFTLMINKLKNMHNPLIIETGCLRQANYADGASTLIFDAYVTEYGGSFYSVDMNPAHVNLAKSKTTNSTITCNDSIRYLYELNKNLRTQNQFVDLLYLDSFDFDANNPHPSSMHHILELLCIWPSCKTGTIIAVDDNFQDGSGKGKYVKQFMDNIGVRSIFSGYQLIWEL